MTDTRRPVWVDDDLFPFESRFVTIDGHRDTETYCGTDDYVTVTKVSKGAETAR
jgi:hypothetical protein